MTQAEEQRKIRGLAIVSIANQIKRINKLHYKIRSQSNENLWYDVVKQYGHNKKGREDGYFTCTCPDFKFRSLICKHIHSVHFSKELRKQIVSEDVIQTPTISLPNSIECVKCKTNDVVKDGKRYNDGMVSRR